MKNIRNMRNMKICFLTSSWITSRNQTFPHIYSTLGSFCLGETRSDYVEWKLAFDKPSLEAILCPHFHRNSPFVPLIIVKNAISCQSCDKCGNGSNMKVSAGRSLKTSDSCTDTERRRSRPTQTHDERQTLLWVTAAVEQHCNALIRQQMALSATTALTLWFSLIHCDHWSLKNDFWSF